MLLNRSQKCRHIHDWPRPLSLSGRPLGAEPPDSLVLTAVRAGPPHTRQVFSTGVGKYTRSAFRLKQVVSNHAQLRARRRPAALALELMAAAARLGRARWSSTLARLLLLTVTDVWHAACNPTLVQNRHHLGTEFRHVRRYRAMRWGDARLLLALLAGICLIGLLGTAISPPRRSLDGVWPIGVSRFVGRVARERPRRSVNYRLRGVARQAWRKVATPFRGLDTIKGMGLGSPVERMVERDLWGNELRDP